MALPPTIPTSFIPHAASAAPRRFRSDLTGAFAYFAYGVLTIVVMLALGVFSYDRILAASQTAKDKEIKKAQENIDSATVEQFVRLRDRLSESETLLAGHPAFSGFFAALEKILPATVRFSTLRLSQGNAGTATVEGSGIAKSFNALAAASDVFAKDGRIKNAVFSDINVNKDSSVSFALSATLDPGLFAFGIPSPAAANAPLATSSARASPEATQGTAPLP